jgi:DNA-binding MarR family transcriptional regulator
MAQLIKDGLIRHFPDPLDKRYKLVSRSEVLSLRVREKAA